jgi:hypothetical protein
MRVTRRARIILATLLVCVLALWFLYSGVVYDACLDRINYDRARWHECQLGALSSNYDRHAHWG